MAKASFVYASYILARPQQVWDALIDPDATTQYWAHKNVSDWNVGSTWEHRRSDGSGTVDICGKVLEADPPARLVLSWTLPSDGGKGGNISRVRFGIEAKGIGSCLTVTHDELDAGSDMLKGISEGWPIVISSLKTFLETGKPLPPVK